MSKLPARELLTSQFDDGQWHARYPSAARTLCGRVAHPQLGRKWPPSCPDCAANAQRWNAIDGCVPSHWGYKRLTYLAA